MEIQKVLSQAEIDSLVEALNNLKDYGHDPEVSDDILNSQVVLSQRQIDQLIKSLNDAKDATVTNTPMIDAGSGILSQSEIDSLIDALNAVRQYDSSGSFGQDISQNQTVLSQDEIDKLIRRLLDIKS